MLQKLVLTQFRNYARLTWAPDALVTVFYGQNGAGKTNLLEALSLLSPGRGLRGAPLPQMARFGADGWGVAAIIHDQHGARDVGVGYNAAMPGRRQVQLDGQSVKSQADLAGLFPVIWLTPQMDRLFSEGAGGGDAFLTGSFSPIIRFMQGSSRRMTRPCSIVIAFWQNDRMSRPGFRRWKTALRATLSPSRRSALRLLMPFISKVPAIRSSPCRKSHYPALLVTPCWTGRL
ncbi:AAA family ATPase [Sorlinia euscelidii]|uniref:AAA family ATPase n=1 Tax=Sorlinia euscelidii TaxID=3081148 RepID=UPI00374E17E0